MTGTYGPNTTEAEAAWYAIRDAATVAWDAATVAFNAAFALATRDLIDPEHFDTLTAPMRAAGIDFDTLGGAND